MTGVQTCALRSPIVRDTQEESSLLDVIDNVLNKGVVLNGDLVLGVANVDLIYAKLSVLLAALDKVMNSDAPRNTRKSRKKASRKKKISRH